jgi:hypothetical protein
MNEPEYPNGRGIVLAMLFSLLIWSVILYGFLHFIAKVV